MTNAFRTLFALLLLLAPRLLQAQGDPLVLVPDGRIENDSIFPMSLTTYLFATQGGHSYSVEQSRGLNRLIVPMFVMPVCPGPSGAPFIDTSLADPAVAIDGGATPQRQRVAFSCRGPVHPTDPPGRTMITIFNNSSAVYTLSIRVTDTTLHSPKWRAATNADTFWSFTNTSSAPVGLSITLLDSNGVMVFLPPNPILIAPGATASADTTPLPPPLRDPPVSGSVRVAYDGPPGAILATEIIITNPGSPNESREGVSIGPKP